jgi:hypothetical protein
VHAPFDGRGDSPRRSDLPRVPLYHRTSRRQPFRPLKFPGVSSANSFFSFNILEYLHCPSRRTGDDDDDYEDDCTQPRSPHCRGVESPPCSLQSNPPGDSIPHAESSRIPNQLVRQSTTRHAAKAGPHDVGCRALYNAASDMIAIGCSRRTGCSRTGRACVGRKRCREDNNTPLAATGETGKMKGDARSSCRLNDDGRKT